MLSITLTRPCLKDLDELLAFETDNRAFFEARINSRPASYYSRDGVAAAIDIAQRDALADLAHQFLIRDELGRIVGRVNLTQVRRKHFHSASLGYRIGEAHNGRGIAKAAVGQMLGLAFGELKLLRLEAHARPENLGSVRVLESNGFKQFGRATRSFELGGQWFDQLFFEAHAPLET